MREAHSPSRGLIDGSYISSGVRLSAPPPRLNQTGILCARASSCRRFTLGKLAMQRGRMLQFSFIMSMIRSAVVEGSIVTSLRIGGGGSFTLFQSETASAIADDAIRVIRAAAKPIFRE